VIFQSIPAEVRVRKSGVGEDAGAGVGIEEEEPSSLGEEAERPGAAASSKPAASRSLKVRIELSYGVDGGGLSGAGAVDYLDKGGTHLNKEHVIRNNLSLQKATSKEVLTRSTYWYEYTEEGHYNEVIAVVNFVRHTNTIEQIVERIKMDLEAANTLYDQLDARYNRLVAIKQDVLSAIGKLSSLSSKQQKELMKATVLALLNDFNSSLTLAYDAIIDYLFQMRKKK